jgi:hypothetical protein
MDLLASQLFWRHAGSIAGFAEKAIQASRRHDPEQQQFVFRSSEPVACILRNEYRPAPFRQGNLTYVVQRNVLLTVLSKFAVRGSLAARSQLRA